MFHTPRRRADMYIVLPTSSVPRHASTSKSTQGRGPPLRRSSQHAHQPQAQAPWQAPPNSPPGPQPRSANNRDAKSVLANARKTDVKLKVKAPAEDSRDLRFLFPRQRI